ncbi:MAG: alcohol dehydrogenase catalytic domain-containing protein [Pirellulales bacterium]|nr:alcohol dehydrogenase catalytic domain-containing protein [Pirellulales bacterium]
MLAAVLKDVNNLVLEEVAKPQPGPRQIVVDVKACGICATDHKAVRGKREVEFPRILGHEIAGVIDTVGSATSKFRPGDEVIISPRGYCGLCEKCRLGLYHYCEDTFSTGGDGGKRFLPGGFAEYMMTDEHNAFMKPAGLSFPAAALTEPLAGAWKGVAQYSNLRIGEDVVVIGTGGIGLLCLMVAHKAGAGRLIAVDVSQHARENALKLGATHAIDPQACNVREQVYGIMPDGPDLVVEAAGPIEAVDMMFALCRRGTRVNLFGITTHEKFALDGGYTHFIETRMDASFSVTPLSMMQSIRLQDRGLIDPEKIISHTFPLENISEAMEVMDQPQRNKVMIVQE